MRLSLLAAIFTTFLSMNSLFSQKTETSLDTTSVEQKRVSFIAIPLAFYLPETRLGFGGAANISLHWKNQSREERQSQFTAGVVYTLNKQLLTYLAYQVYTPRETYWFRGELGYYDYLYPYFGMGQERVSSNSNFFSSYPRFRLDVLRQIKKNIFVGMSYRFDDYKIKDIDDEQGLFDQIDLSGGITSGFGIAAVIDTRNIINNPTDGMLFDLTYQINDTFTGATYDYSALNISFSKYMQLGKHVLALNFNTTNIFGDAPFYELALYGGGKRARGYIEGEYRDKNSFSLQAEYRIALSRLPRFALVLFCSAGQVFSDLDELSFNYTRPAVGTGLRYLLSKEQNLNLRADIGVGQNGLQFYVTFGEAF